MRESRTRHPDTTAHEVMRWKIDAKQRSGIIPSGGASAVQKPGHFRVRKFSIQVTRMHFFPQKSWRPFLVVALKTQAANAVSPSK